MDEKKYDLFTNMVQNQDFSYDDLISAGLNSSNTELKDKDTYKRSEKVQELFKNDSGQFDEVKFNNFYNTASIFYNQMATADYNASVEKAAVYHRDNIFAPAEQRKEGPDFTTYKTINPYRSTSGLTELGKVQDSPFSISELAQDRKVLLNPVEAEKDPNKAQWGAAPNDNFLGYFLIHLYLLLTIKILKKQILLQVNQQYTKRENQNLAQKETFIMKDSMVEILMEGKY